MPVDQAAGVKRRRYAAAQQTQGAHGKGGGRVVDFEGEIRFWMCRGFESRRFEFAGEKKMAVTDGPEAGEVIDGAKGAMVNGATADIDRERAERSELLTVGVVDAKAGICVEVVDVAGEVGLGAQEAAPAAVLAEEHTAHLAQRRLVPLGMELDGDLIEGGGAVNRAFDADQAGVGEIEVEVGSRGLRLKAKLPLVGLGEPDGEVGVEKGEGLFFERRF